VEIDKLVSQGGPVIQRAVVQPIFWGTEWNKVAATAMQLVSDLNQLFAGPYMRGLVQYGGISPASLLPPMFDPASSPPDPLTISSVATYIKDLLAAMKVPDYRTNDQLLYVVFTISRSFEFPAGGYHYFDTIDNQAFHWAWVDGISAPAASHEIIEACTDPEGNGFRQPGNGIEVADICERNVDGIGASDEIQASAYWSNIDGSCILPHRVGRLTLSMATDDECHIGPTIGSQSTINLILGVEPSWIDALDFPLANPQYVWSFNHKLVAPVGPTNTPSLVLKWTGITRQPTRVSLTVTDQRGIRIKASLDVTVRSQKQAALLGQLCTLRQFINSVTQVSPIRVDPLRAGFAELPAEAEITRLNVFARQLSQRVQQISLLSESVEREFADS
jgi:hypothetical protein